jgi:hypothetical protein
MIAVVVPTVALRLKPVEVNPSRRCVDELSEWNRLARAYNAGKLR